jgi:hypothetical protein
MPVEAAGPAASVPPGRPRVGYLQNGHGQQPDAATFVAAAAVVANTPNRTAARPNSLAFIDCHSFRTRDGISVGHIRSVGVEVDFKVKR